MFMVEAAESYIEVSSSQTNWTLKLYFNKPVLSPSVVYYENKWTDKYYFSYFSNNWMDDLKT